MMIKEIGSTFFLPPKKIDLLKKKSLKRPNILNVDESYVSTCRSAIGLCLETLSVSRKVALLPAFTCESVIEPFIKSGYEVFPYSIGLNLNIIWDKFVKEIEEVKPSVVLTHPYFGFNTTEELREHVQELILKRNIIFIEDMTQSMFSNFKPLPSSFHVGSIRKWMPIPDGAFTTAPFLGKDEDKELVEAKMKALTEKGDYILNGKGKKEDYRNDFVKAEHILDSRKIAYSMSSVSRKIFSETDIQEIIKTRRINYAYLLNHIKNDSILLKEVDIICEELSGDICPFHFPVFVKERRNTLQLFLAKNNIYATIIWKCPTEFEKKINKDDKYVYDHILCFHVDQRYNTDDMKRIVTTLHYFYKTTK